MEQIKRYFLEVAYHGKAYKGWQVQPQTKTVQGTLEYCLSKLLKQTISLTASGRTDAGVHCRSQFAHFDVPQTLEKPHFLHRLNAFLPADIAALSLKEVSPVAHARFNALSRTYHYHITLQKEPFLQGLAYYYHFEELSLEKLQAAALLLLGEHDFKAFSKTHTDVNHYHCEIFKADWEQNAHRLVFTIQANRFLRGMVRLITGALLEVGRGNMDNDQLVQLIARGEQAKKRFSVPAEGLYLSAVSYPPNIFLS